MGSSVMKARNARNAEIRRNSDVRTSLTLSLPERREKSLEQTGRSMSTNPSPVNAHINLTSLSILRPIGAGSCSYVQLALDKSTNRLLALKTYSKAHVLKSGQVRQVQREVQALELVRSVWLPQLLGCGQDDRKLYIAMEFVQGGDLFRQLRKVGRFTLREVNFYASEIVCALSDIHAWKFVYRDLKPENVMMNADGHIRLVDLHLAKFLKSDSRTKTLCGTPEYIAPEVIERTGHGQEVDWWQLGILLYEMLSSRTPFYDPSPYVLYSNILTKEVKFPGYFDHSACRLISGLLAKSPKKRLTEQQIRSDEFFAEIDWSKAAYQQLSPPLVFREVGNEVDRFFDKFRNPCEWEKVDECFLGF